MSTAGSRLARLLVHVSALILFHPLLSTAQHVHDLDENGFDPTMDMPMSLAAGRMVTYLHFTPGDVLWFQGWVPGRGSTMFGACFALFMLGLGERWVVALRASLELALRRGRLTSSQCPSKASSWKAALDVIRLRDAPPLLVEHSLSRGVLHIIQTSMVFLAMLAIMTFQISFIFSLIIGLGVGEMLYGRYTDAANAQLLSH